MGDNVCTVETSIALIVLPKCGHLFLELFVSVSEAIRWPHRRVEGVAYIALQKFYL